MIVMTALDEMLATLRAHMECGANSYANRELYRELMGFVEAARAENAALCARLELADKLAEAAANYRHYSYCRPFYENYEAVLIDILADYRAEGDQ